MKNPHFGFKPTPRCGPVLAVCIATLLSACNSGGDTATTGQQTVTPLATGTTTLQLQVPALPADVAVQTAQPTFHIAPVLLNEPADTDAASSDASANMSPHTQGVPAELAGLSSQRLTVPTLKAARQMRNMSAQLTGADASLTPMASSSVVATYSPAQIRAAYGLPALPATGTVLTAAQAAQQGAGQTIYLIDAMHDPMAAAELAAFNQKFGLPGCTTKTIAATASLPLAAANAGACEFSQVYNTASGTLTSTAPAYDSGWATEITLDVQWAHATAPLARIVLIEAADASLNSLLGAVKLANAMGPGVVSMSFGATEGNWTASVDSTFAAPNMSYLAATGDSGAAVSWPAVSPNVVAVGGTTLTYTGSGPRSEVSWSGTGGGTSAYTPTPGYQTNAVPGMGVLAHRTVADVSFNADPSTGQYLAILAPGGTAVSWVSVGGTSLSTPQWAGLIAIANASRAQAAKPALGAPHALLYGQIATVPGSYASAFADITKGSDGSCGTCTAKAGYDPLTGLGTPNVSSLMPLLTGTAASTAPVVSGASISGQVGTALSFTVSVAASNPVSYSLSGAPSGMVISTSGGVTWPTPVAGTYSVTVSAKDTKTNLSGQGVYTVTIAAPLPPVVNTATVSGQAGVALSFATSVTSPDPLTYALSGAPSGLAISATGTISWPAPVIGAYRVTVTARDTKTNLSGQGVYTINIAAQPAPVVTSETVSGKPGTILSFTVPFTASNPVSFALSGAPAGLTISTSGVVNWANPVVGSYSVTVTARDSRTGLSGQGVITLKIASSSLVITAPAMNGVAGKSMSGNITISDPGASALSLSIAGAPMGMSFSASGMTITATWANPVTGSYTLSVSAADNLGQTTHVNVPVTVFAR